MFGLRSWCFPLELWVKAVAEPRGVPFFKMSERERERVVREEEMEREEGESTLGGGERSVGQEGAMAMQRTSLRRGNGSVSEGDGSDRGMWKAKVVEKGSGVVGQGLAGYVARRRRSGVEVMQKEAMHRRGMRERSEWEERRAATGEKKRKRRFRVCGGGGVEGSSLQCAVCGVQPALEALSCWLPNVPLSDGDITDIIAAPPLPWAHARKPSQESMGPKGRMKSSSTFAHTDVSVLHMSHIARVAR